jgi:hypothetical protein
MGTIRTRSIAACVATAAILACTAFAGSAQASSQQTSCSSLGLLAPILGNPTCTTAPIIADLPSDVGHTYAYAAQSKARSLLLPAGVRIDFYINGVLAFPNIAQCNNSSGSTCNATFQNSGPVVPLGWHTVQIKCTWTNRLAIIATTDCKQTLLTAPPVIA